MKTFKTFYCKFTTYVQVCGGESVMYPFHRSANTQPVSQVVSSQVTNTSATSPDIAVQLTFNYSVDVSS